ncbi:MAG: dihydrofolate reductase [Candidatus Moranbacteria bacterium]|jgi:dihydrofolate reductase|nr:dihydrofolate reductase [Candidatus Moranbacteria bacterium]
MKKPTLSIICAIAQNRAIGKNNQLLWHIKKDFQFFKDKTLGHVLLMGQKTYESIGKPLPGRTTVVISNNPDFNPKDIVVSRSLEEGIEKAMELEKDEVFICGGGSIYAQTINLANKLYLTIVAGEFEADVFFPEYSSFKNIISVKEDSEGAYKFKFLELTK